MGDTTPLELTVSAGRLPAASGHYRLADGGHNGEAVWIGSFGKRVFTAKGRWYVGNAETMRKDSGWIRSAAHHGVPPHMLEGVWEAFEKVGEPWKMDGTIEVTLRQKSHGRALPGARADSSETDETASLWEADRHVLRDPHALAAAQQQLHTSTSQISRTTATTTASAAPRHAGAGGVLKPTPVRPPPPATPNTSFRQELLQQQHQPPQPMATAAAAAAATAPPDSVQGGLAAEALQQQQQQQQQPCGSTRQGVRVGGVHPAESAAAAAAQQQQHHRDVDVLRAENAALRSQLERREAGVLSSESAAVLRGELARNKQEREALSVQVAQLVDASRASDIALRHLKDDLRAAAAARDRLLLDAEAKDAHIASLEGDVASLRAQLSEAASCRAPTGGVSVAPEHLRRLEQWAVSVLKEDSPGGGV